MADCVFCKIGKREQVGDILFETDQLFVLRDIMPKAPVHLLIIPKEHIASVNEVIDGHGNLLAQMILTAKTQAAQNGIGESGYKLVFNVGKDGGQVIPHLHLHVLGGKAMPE